MKTIKTNSLKTLFNLSLILVLFNFSCKQTAEKSTTEIADNTKKESTVSAPKIDLQTAILTDNIEAVKQHIEAGTNINLKDAMSGSTPIITAASFGKKESAQLLIDAGANLTSTNNDGATALHTAAFFCRTEIVEMLLDAKADKSLKNKFGSTARETVMMPFENIKPVYEMLKLQLEPMGMQIDLNYIEKTRPIVADMLQ